MTTVIIINGFPCTGKTTLGKKLAADLQLPLFSRDALKEILFDELGWSDREWSKKVGKASYTLLYHLLEDQLRAEKVCIIESPFTKEFDQPKLRALQERYGFHAKEILCFADGAVLLERFTRRAHSDARHAGHVDATHVYEFRGRLLKGKMEHLGLRGDLFEVDTTDFDNIDYPAILAFAS